MIKQIPPNSGLHNMAVQITQTEPGFCDPAKNTVFPLFAICHEFLTEHITWPTTSMVFIFQVDGTSYSSHGQELILFFLNLLANPLWINEFCQTSCPKRTDSSSTSSVHNLLQIFKKYQSCENVCRLTFYKIFNKCQYNLLECAQIFLVPVCPIPAYKADF